MNEKEISEIRRTLRFEHTTITKICGCYVNGAGEIITKFSVPFGMLSADEAEKYLSLFKRSLSGTKGKTLFDLSFTTAQVTDSEEHKRLTELKNSRLEEGALLDAFYQVITNAYISEENYVILLTYCAYDIPFRAKDGQKTEGDGSVYSFILGSICPVKMSKSALVYSAPEKQFRFGNGENAIAAPETGFLFPAFDDRQTNIYGALYYAANEERLHEELVATLFATPLPMTATAENEAFRGVLAETMEEGCSFAVMKNLHREISQKIEEHKTSKDSEPLVLSKHQTLEILEECGMSEEKREAFIEHFDESFGKGTDLSPKSLANPKKFEIETPNVIIKVAPERSDLVETRIIDGVKYILIRAEDGVELNGMNVNIE